MNATDPKIEMPQLVATGDLFGLLDIEQPDRITESGHFFFLRGWSHSGAEYGARLTREEVVRALVAKAGPGELVEKDGRFFFRLNIRNLPRDEPGPAS